MKKCTSKAILFVAAFIFIQVQMCVGQAKGPAQTFIEKEVVYWEYHSVTIGDDYTIYVHVPPGYDTSGAKYPVLYVTDGDWDKNTASNSFAMLRQDYITTEAVIVGIGYGERTNQRNRDLEPTTGGPNFLAFIEKEVIPFIENKYRVTEDRTLSGYSYGGLFAAYVLFNRPGLFNTVCIGAPWKSSELLLFAQKYFATNKELKAKVFLGVGAYEPGTVSNINLLKAYLLKQNCKTLEVESEIVPNASHGAAKPPVIQNGISFAYCKKHKAITLPVKELAKYVGTYALTGNQDNKIKFYVENKKLYFDSGGGPLEFFPFTKDGFFNHRDEREEMIFKTEGGKMYGIYMPYHQTPVRFEKIN